MASRDYEEFIGELNARGVKYLIIGAHAVAHHARPRATKDLDIYLDPTDRNARRTLAAIRAFFGGVDLGYTIEDVTNPRWIIQLGVAPVRIDLMSKVEGISDFASAWKNRQVAMFNDVEANYLSLKDLIQAKQASGRSQDKADLRVLRRALKAIKQVRRRM